MNLPLFYFPHLDQKMIVLDEDNSKHITGVLRMQVGEELLLTDGKGKKVQVFVVDDNRKKCRVEISSVVIEEKRKQQIAIGISLIKNTSRFEWFLEKATELGVDEIIPLICQRTEKEKFRADRMNQILTSAMTQSQQSWLPLLHEPMSFEKAISLVFEKKFIAHCLANEKKDLAKELDQSISSQLLLIGPEGDFTSEEIKLALQNNFLPVALGNTRLRTETAGIVGATLLKFSTAN